MTTSPGTAGERDPSAAERLAAELREDILRGELPQGGPLREVSIAEAHGVSRRTVREALLLLANQRLVAHERNRGATVRTLEADDVTDLYLVRRTLELQGARGAPFASTHRRAALSAAYERLAAAAHGDDSREVVRTDLAFHGAVAGLAGSPRLQAAYEQVSAEMEMALSVIRGGEAQAGWGAEQIIADHRTIHDTLLAGDVVEAQRAILAHIDLNERFLLDLLRDRASQQIEY